MSMNSSIAFRAFIISGVSVSMTMPSAASSVHEDCSLCMPSTRTRHMRHPPKLSTSGSWHMLGIFIPFARAASITLTGPPSSIRLPLIVIVIMACTPRRNRRP